MKLCAEAKVSFNTMAKLGKSDSVWLEVLTKICNHLGRTLDDIVVFYLMKIKKRVSNWIYGRSEKNRA